MRRGISLQSVFYSPETSTAFPAKKVPGKSPGPDTSITVLRLCRFCSELLFIIHSKHKKQLRHAAFLFCIFHTVLLPERFADHRSAFTFGTHLWDSPEGHPVTVPSFWGHLRVLFLRRAYAFFPATFYWLDIQLKCMSTVALCYMQGQVYTPGRHLSIRGCIFFIL